MKKWDWLRNYMREQNISQQEAAEALQWKKTRISELLCGKRDLPVDKVFLAARFFNLNLEQLTKYNSGYSDDIPEQFETLPAQRQIENMFFVDIIDASKSKGKGLETAPIGRQPFNENLSNILSLPKSHALKIIIARGDAMMPTINDKDIVLVDISITKPENDGLYLFDIQGELFIKRLAFNEFDHSATIISDNQLYPPIMVSDLSKLFCLGKILAVCKAIH
ncbi:MAG: LexA family transcriptional regulator [Azospirillum sp.]|nr:LexA family transcriptional regulator [Azospirillum sp.]